MKDNIEHWEKISRATVIFNLALAILAFCTWGLLMTRASEFIQRGYYYYDGTMMMALVLCLVFPIMVLVYYFFNFKSIRIINSVLQFTSAGLGFAILYIYVGMVETFVEPPYIIIGQLVQDNIALILSHFLCNFLLAIINILLLVTPYKAQEKERTRYGIERESENKDHIGLTPGVGIPGVERRDENNNVKIQETARSKNKYNLTMGLGIGGGFLILALVLHLIHKEGLVEYFYIIYSLTIFGGFTILYSTKRLLDIGMYQEKTINASHFMEENSVKMYAVFAPGIVVLVGIAMKNLPLLETIPFLIVFLLILILMASLRIIMDTGKKPQRQSDVESLKVYRLLRKRSVTFGFYSIYGGFMVLAGGYLFTIDIDRYYELLSYAKLFVCVAVMFCVILFLLQWIPGRIWHLISWLSLLSVVFLEMKQMDIAATTDWYLDPQNIIEGFPFFQSWPHAFLCSIPIATVFAIFFNYYREFHMETQYHGVHLELQMLFLFTLLFLGLIIGHDQRISGPHNSEFNPSAREIYDLLAIIFYVVLGFLIVTIIITFVGFYKDEKPVLVKKMISGKTLKLTGSKDDTNGGGVSSE